MGSSRSDRLAGCRRRVTKKPLVDEAIDQDPFHYYEGLPCCSTLPLSRQTLTFAAGVIRRHRAWIGSRWRRLNPGQQALLVLAYLWKGETFTDLAAGFGVGTTTAWRYVRETVALLAGRAPKLRTAVQEANSAGYAYVVLDGTLIPIDRVAATGPSTPASTRSTA